MNIDNNVLKENIIKYCSFSGNSIDSLCSKIKTLSTCVLAIKGLIIAVVTILLTKFLQNPIYSQIFLLVVAMWYLNKYTSIKDFLMEEVVRKMHAKITESSLQEEKTKSNDEDPEDVPAPLS